MIVGAYEAERVEKLAPVSGMECAVVNEVMVVRLDHGDIDLTLEGVRENIVPVVASVPVTVVGEVG